MDRSTLTSALRKIAALALVMAGLWLNTTAKAGPVDPSQLTPTELYNQAMAAYNGGDWATAEPLFDAFIKTYGAAPETTEAARKLKPLLATSRLQQKKYEETLPLLEEVLKDPLLDPLAADELAFWRGICHLQLDDHDAARVAFGEFYSGKLPYVPKLPVTHQKIHQGRRTEALLLNGMCIMLKGEFKAAAAFFQQHIPTLRTSNRDAAGRATVLCLHSLIEAGDDDGALKLIRETYPRMDEISQVVVFQTLSLELGSKLLEEGRYYDAISCLQRIWTKEKLLATQRRNQALFSSRLEQVKSVPGQEYLAFQYEGLLTRINRELEVFEKIPNFDSALRLRIAMAYKELERYREAALVLEDMLHRLPPDDVVRQSSLSLIQCWLQIERWPRAVEAANAYLARFPQPENPDLPMAKYLKATALHSDHKAPEAEVAFAEISQLHGQTPMAARSLFMEGICLLEQDLNTEAMEAFAQLAKEHPKSDLVEDAEYWTGMALSFAKRHEECRRKMEEYLQKRSRTSRYGADATFRIAFSTFGLADYPRAIGELRAFIAKGSESQFFDEARLILGDALGAQGKLDEAIAAYQSVDAKVNPRYAEEAWFKIGNIYKAAGRLPEMRAHFEKFVSNNPTSNRIAEAVYWISTTHDKEGHRDLAREACWKALREHGREQASRGVEDIFSALQRYYPGDEGRADLTSRLDALARSGGTAPNVLTLRATWAKAELWQKKDPVRSREWLVGLTTTVDPSIHSSRITSDIADALRESGMRAQATHLYTEMRRWHPRAVEKDRACYGLGKLALEAGQPEMALKEFDRFEQETLGSALEGEVALLRGDLLAGQGKFPEAQAAYEKALEMRTASRLLKAQALIKLGDFFAARKEDLKATAYYERVYVSYARYAAENATAYWRRGEALVRLSLQEKADEVFLELATREDLRQQPERPLAEAWLDARRPNWRLESITQAASNLPTPTPAPAPADANR